jgi:RNA polymerase sigma-70 factor (ECF subfamily)
VYYLALNLTGNHHDAEDLSQEVFIKAHRGLKEFRGDAQMYTWLRRIAVNTYLNKKRKKALAFFRVFAEDDETDRSPSAEPETDAAAEAGFLRGRINRALETLTARERTAFVLRHHHELSVREVAASMNVAEGTVKSLLFRATQKLQKELAPLQSELGPGR